MLSAKIQLELRIRLKQLPQTKNQLVQRSQFSQQMLVKKQLALKYQLIKLQLTKSQLGVRSLLNQQMPVKKRLELKTPRSRLQLAKSQLALSSLLSNLLQSSALRKQSNSKISKERSLKKRKQERPKRTVFKACSVWLLTKNNSILKNYKEMHHFSVKMKTTASWSSN